MKQVRKIFYTELGNLREVWEVTGMFLMGALILVVFVIAPITGVVTLVESNKCDTLSSYDSVHEYRFNFWSGCRVETAQGYWIDSDNPALIELE